MKNPHMVFKVPGSIKFEDYSYDSQVVDEDAVEAACAEGWYASLREAKEGARPAPAEASDVVQAPAAENGATTREDLEAQAVLLGIEVDGRWSDKTLAAKIKEAQG